jgi:MFS family permease
MRGTLDLFRKEPRARVFFLVYAQSSLGTGAGYVALLLIAYERFRSPWAISLVLIAELLPAMFLGPVFGAAADRWSRRWCAVVADLCRAVAFVALGIVGSFEATVALALLAGAGTGLFTPAVLAALPSLVDRERLPAATSVYGALADFGYTLGPALAAVVLLAGGPETVMVANGASFAISAVVLARLPFGVRPEIEAVAGGRPSLLREARDGLRAAARMPGIRTVLVATGALLYFGGIFNVGELLFATEELGASDSSFSVLVAIFGLGFIAGSLAGSSGGALPTLKRRYLAGILIMGGGFVGCGIAPTFAAALGAFAIAGFGNGLILVYERLLMQTTVADGMMGRIFGVKDALTAWAFAVAFLSAGGIISLIGTRPMFVLAGIGGIVVWAIAAVALRRLWTSEHVVPTRAEVEPVAPLPEAPSWRTLPSEALGGGPDPRG